jgi:hypothetical protein
MTYSPPAREAAFYFQQLLPALSPCESDFYRVDTAFLSDDSTSLSVAIVHQRPCGHS